MSPVLNHSPSMTSAVAVRVVPVAVEHVDALDQDLAVVGDLEPDARERGADGADLELRDQVDRRRRRRLGEAVALEDLDVQAAEEVPEVACRAAPIPRRRTGCCRPWPPSACCRPAGRTARTGASARGARDPRRAPSSARRRRRAAARKILPLPAALGLLLGRVVDLLEHARHGEQEGRLEAAERRQQLLRVGLVADLDAGVHGEDRDEAREDVRGRDEQQRG